MKTLTGHSKLTAGSIVQLLLNYCQLSDKNSPDISKDFRYISRHFKIFIYLVHNFSRKPTKDVLWLVCPSFIFIQRFNRVLRLLTSQQKKMAGAVVPYSFHQTAWQPE